MKFEDLSEDIQDSIIGFINEPEPYPELSEPNPNIIRPKRYKLWNVLVSVNGDMGRIQVASDEENYSGTVELRVKNYYETIIKKDCKLVVKATLSQNRKSLLHF